MKEHSPNLVPPKIIGDPYANGRRIFVMSIHTLGITAKSHIQDCVSSSSDDAGGAQSIHRSLQVMRLLASAPPRGLKLVDIAAMLGLSHPTAHRILKALENEGVVERPDGSKRYRVGKEMVWFGLSAYVRFPINSAAAIPLERASEQIGETLLMSVRSGNDSVCVNRRSRPGSPHVTSASVGSRRPLHMTPSGKTMLAFLPEEVSESLMAASDDRTHHSKEQAIDFAKTTRAQGFGLSDGLSVKQTCAITIPVFNSVGVPIAALCAIGPKFRIPDHRISHISRVLRDCSRAISDALLRNEIELTRSNELAS